MLGSPQSMGTNYVISISYAWHNGCFTVRMKKTKLAFKRSTIRSLQADAVTAGAADLFGTLLWCKSDCVSRCADVRTCQRECPIENTEQNACSVTNCLGGC